MIWLQMAYSTTSPGMQVKLLHEVAAMGLGGLHAAT
jgi:hypothetical protein